MKPGRPRRFFGIEANVSTIQDDENVDVPKNPGSNLFLKTRKTRL